MQPVFGRQPGYVVSYCPVASAHGMRVLEEGGNAVDAAVATGLALAVTYPQAGNIGGGGFMLIAPHKEPVSFLDYREVAPKNITPQDYLVDGRRGEAMVLGAKSAAVPGTIAGFAKALETHGTMAWDRIVGQIVDLAENGVIITSRQAAYLNAYRETLSRFESTRKVFGRSILPATRFLQPDLAQTFRRLAEHGPRDFYRGRLAALLLDEIRRGGGPMSLDDLVDFEAKWRVPFTCEAFGRRIWTAPFPSGGGLVVHLTLRILDGLGYASLPARSLERYQLLIRAFRVAFWMRQTYAVDPDFLTEEQQLEIETLLECRITRSQLEEWETKLRQDKRLLENEAAYLRSQNKNTTHFSVLDSAGNAVSNTYSLNTLFGSKLVVNGAGYLLNNTLDDFGVGRGTPNWYGILDGDRNTLAGGRRPVGSMAPTIVEVDGVPELVIGGSGGPTIPTMVVQTLLGLVLDGRSVAAALAEPRVHHQHSKAELRLENAVAQSIRDTLFLDDDPRTFVSRIGIGAAIHRDRDTGQVQAALDPRFGLHGQ
ncbi:MAG: gamma-glutamyltransferase [Deltaproteobacteria bacterium]